MRAKGDRTSERESELKPALEVGDCGHAVETETVPSLLAILFFVSTQFDEINSPIITLTPHERKFLIGDHSYPALEYHLNAMKDGYKILIDSINSNEV